MNIEEFVTVLQGILDQNRALEEKNKSLTELLKKQDEVIDSIRRLISIRENEKVS